jgi:hypothetical protein
MLQKALISEHSFGPLIVTFNILSQGHCEFKLLATSGVTKTIKEKL